VSDAAGGEERIAVFTVLLADRDRPHTPRECGPKRSHWPTAGHGDDTVTLRRCGGRSPNQPGSAPPRRPATGG
jgi:hypothetical protein